MKELSFAQNFSVIALNAQDSLHLTTAKKVFLRCMAAATILELYLDNGFKTEGDFLILNQEDLNSPEISRYHKAVLKTLFSKKETLSEQLPQYLKKVTKLSKKMLKEVEHAFAVALTEANALEEIPALLGCDLEYVTAGISMKEYRSNSELFSRLTESLRAETLETGPMTDEAILMLWLLRESGCIHDFFSREELKRVAERIFELQGSSSLAKQVFPITIHKTIEMGIKNFLKSKKDVMSTASGSGINFVFPVIERSQSVFIDTEKVFANKEERLRDIKARLESKGHIFTVIREGEVPLIKIDNVLYEAVPSAKLYRIPVHGVRLRKYPLSL
ncbi:hypothetical protein [Neobacillus vireti]|uniref:Uncharacterized protein n=1 Tax=Neobacillus vireti LMG 21834 TaxID=1131730 RepID=A0AB94IHC8_9BACI|nr:hypothetical protein [Neobacillus vireti]ETI66521.1 hypothetical protein BAVI_22238 [Neobacillus vireti LMG 21834]KLT17897.1 hypothetical protein AA980_12520 [Neobacillus vireti]